MALLDRYRHQVALLIRALPFVAEEPDFALKGGTAINLFVRDMPRLSVDIDLAYLPVQDRPTSLTAIDEAMKRIAARIANGIPGAQVAPSVLRPEGIVTKLVIRSGATQIKIEVTPVLRGCVYEPSMSTVSPTVEDAFGFAAMRVISFADLYAGKIVATLDRQHPRDLFDVRDLLANEGVSDELRRAFIVYILSHDRPIAEVLAPKRKPLADEFRRGFVGMTKDPVTLAELEAAREALIATMVGEMPDNHRSFLASFKRGVPDWALLDIPGVENLPAVKWKQHNLDKLSTEARAGLADALEKVLFPDG